MEKRRVEINKWFFDAGLTQAELAKRVGVNRATVKLVLNGKSNCFRILDFPASLGYLEKLF
ncbi:MAG: helix-turn-helix domain-containing protein [Candidatus Riflebacteria bacterium]|nr:helix-turn-helix domain-containing protein [Candidatus Riflebacteria bacterium]